MIAQKILRTDRGTMTQGWLWVTVTIEGFAIIFVVSWFNMCCSFEYELNEIGRCAHMLHVGISDPMYTCLSHEKKQQSHLKMFICMVMNQNAYGKELSATKQMLMEFYH
eukprot:2362919-Amphidinium_carterae.1